MYGAAYSYPIPGDIWALSISIDIYMVKHNYYLIIPLYSSVAVLTFSQVPPFSF